MAHSVLQAMTQATEAASSGEPEQKRAHTETDAVVSGMSIIISEQELCMIEGMRRFLLIYFVLVFYFETKFVAYMHIWLRLTALKFF